MSAYSHYVFSALDVQETGVITFQVIYYYYLYSCHRIYQYNEDDFRFQLA